MYFLVVVIALLLSSVPAQSRTIQDLIEKIPGKTEEDYIPLSTITENNKHAELEMDEPLIMFGDIAVPSGLQNAAACTARGCKWQRSRNGLVYVPYIISNQYSPKDISVIETGMQSFADVSCIRFVPHQGQRHFIHIKSNSGCYSYLGRQDGEQVVSLQQSGCVNPRTVQHELLHALGFHHEQNRSDRDRHIRILFQNIYPEQQHNFRKADTNNLDTPYDYNSVMHYRKTAFSLNNEPTMIPIPDENVEIGTAKRMSPNDILRINRLYCR
ncbi:hatching enzyme 1.2-like isoform X2 [Siphateles boraxobius]